MEMSGYAYRAKAGETADSIALLLYGSERYAPELLCANPEYVGRAVMGGGELWRMPKIDTPSADQMSIPETAPWKG